MWMSGVWYKPGCVWCCLLIYVYRSMLGWPAGLGGLLSLTVCVFFISITTQTEILEEIISPHLDATDQKEF